MVTRRDVMVGGLALAASGAVVGSGVTRAQAQPTVAAAGVGAAASASTYQAGSTERKLDIINLHDLEAEARNLIPKPQFGYISSGSGDEWTLRENVRAFDDYTIQPRYLAGVTEPDISTELLGAKVKTPIFIPRWRLMAWLTNAASLIPPRVLRMPVRYSPRRLGPISPWPISVRQVAAPSGSSCTSPRTWASIAN